MTNTALMVLPNYPAIKHSSTEVSTEVEDFEDGESEVDGETYEEVQQEIAALELRLGADTDRCMKVIEDLNKKNMPLLVQMQQLEAEILKRSEELMESDDLVDKVNAEEQKQILEDMFNDDDEDTKDRLGQGDLEEQLSELKLGKKCRAIFRAIAKGTHPDRCRHLPKEEIARRNQLFILAKEALKNNNYDALEKIHMEVFNKAYAKVNLIQRLMIARRRRDELEARMNELRESPEWQLFCVALRFGVDTANEQYRMSLQNTIIHMRSMLDSMNNTDDDEYIS